MEITPAAAPKVDSITRTDAVGDAWTVAISRPKDTMTVTGAFRTALQKANEMVRAETSWTGTRLGDAPTIGIFQAADGAYALGQVRGSIHLFHPVDSPKYVAASAAKQPGSDLLALVSRDNWIDLRNTDAADAKRLLRVPGIGLIIAR